MISKGARARVMVSHLPSVAVDALAGAIRQVVSEGFIANVLLLAKASAMMRSHQQYLLLRLGHHHQSKEEEYQQRLKFHFKKNDETLEINSNGP